MNGKTTEPIIIFDPIYDASLKTWVNESIENIASKEDPCQHCKIKESCPIFRKLDVIKNKYGNDFILTRCKNHQYINSEMTAPEKQEHYNAMVWVNPFTESIREKQCMCINDCLIFNKDNHDENCKIANELFELCVMYELALIMFKCPLWDEL
jgi:hypothetical protein